MQEDYSRAATNMCRVIMYPLVKMFLRMGISHKALSNIIKHVYVDVAMEAGPRKRNVSDIAVKTGISRKEVVRVLDAVDELTISESRRLAVNKVIDNWFLLKEYLDEDGGPRPLSMTHESDICLEDLVQTAKLDIPSSTVCRQVIQSSNVRKNRLGQYYPISDQHICTKHDADGIEYIQSALFSYASTLYRNVFCGESEDRPKLFERRAYARHIPRNKLTEFCELAELKGDAVIRDLNEWLVKNSSEGLTADPNQGLTGIAIYTYDFSKLPYS